MTPPRSARHSDALVGRRGLSTIAVLTVTEREFAAAQRIFETTININGSPYFVRAPSPSKRYDIVVRRAADRTNTPAGQATAGIIEDFWPSFLLLVGTAGGVFEKDTGRGRDDTSLGDVVIADFVDYSEFQKLRDGKHLQRNIPYDHPSLYLRESFAEPLKGENRWHAWIGENRPDGNATPRVIVGNVVACEKILSDVTSEYQQKLVAHFDKAVAFETESFGVGREIFRARRSVHYNPQYLTIRGISDWVNAEESNDIRRAWTPYAASTAMAFARCVTEQVLTVQKSQPRSIAGSTLYKIVSWLTKAKSILMGR